MDKIDQHIFRDSSIELLRLVCMLMIVIHHFIMQPAAGNTFFAQSLLGQIINSLCYISVNCFVFISGWFGIRVKRKSFLNLYFICAFYGLCTYLFNVFYNGASIGRTLILQTLFPFSHSQWWFINCYLILYLSAPLLNAAIEHISKKQYLSILALFSVMNIYFGNVLQTPFFNQDGYSVDQFVYLYLLAGYMRRYISMEWINQHRWMMFTNYIICSLMYVSCAQASHLSFVHLGYNNFFNIAAAISFFLFVISFHFQSRVVNYLAGSALAVYLIQESRTLGHGWLYPMVCQLYVEIPPEGHMQILVSLGLLIGCSLTFFVVCIATDQIRRSLSNWFVSGVEFMVSKVKINL